MAQYGPALRAYFRKKVGTSEAEDLVQDVFVAMQARGGVEDIEHVGRYLFRVAANVMARRSAPDRWRWSEHAELSDLEALIDELSPERALIAKDTLVRLIASLRAVPPRAAQAFILHRFEEMSYGEIAAQMGLSVRSVESHIKRTLDRVLAEMGASR
ncbi:MAG TPA: sigma-70 family RNA polymerase sigma factor [Caulobacteraceae bacterium]|nr:sigma-70 family RNA polymerase sigma factor [Caulobacteraceae bacterium]